jgi:hypothetical protein
VGPAVTADEFAALVTGNQAPTTSIETLANLVKAPRAFENTEFRETLGTAAAREVRTKVFFAESTVLQMTVHSIFTLITELPTAALAEPHRYV